MMKILIIDDDSLVRNAYALTLEDLDYDVTAVASGENGIREFEQNTFNLILLDLNMPGMDGIETLREIRKQDAEIAVYIISGFHSAYLDGLNQLKDEGLHFELAKKPLNRDQLKQIVESVLESLDIKPDPENST